VEIKREILAHRIKNVPTSKEDIFFFARTLQNVHDSFSDYSIKGNTIESLLMDKNDGHKIFIALGVFTISRKNFRTAFFFK